MAGGEAPVAGRGRVLTVLLLLVLAVLALALFFGRYPRPGFISPHTLSADELAQRLVWDLRLPRLLAALLLGMSLAAAGAVFQTVFGNPLVEPGFLGVSQGASFGAAFSIIFLGNSAVMVQTSSAFFAFIGLGTSYVLARKIRFGGWVLRLVLSGIAVSAFFAAGLGVLKYLADPLSELPEITFWLLGGLWSITWDRLVTILPAVLVGLFVVYRMRWRLNLLSLGDETSFSLGMAPTRERIVALTAATLATAAVISVSGMVGWVGLITPHMARRLFGADTRFALPAAMLLGGLFTIICDTMARSLLAGEIPLGILTSLLGALFFASLMMTQPRRRRA